SRRADDPSSRRPAEPTTRRADRPPSRQPAESTTRRADESLPRRVDYPPLTAEPPASRAAQQPSRPAAELPSSRAAETPCSRVATAPTGTPRPHLLGLCDRADGLSLFDLTSGASPAPPATADSTVRSQWATRNAAARLAVRHHLPTTERVTQHGECPADRLWHTLRTTLAALGFAPSTTDPSLFLRTDTSLPPFYILVYVDNLVFAAADTAGLAHVKSELQKRHTCTDLGELRSYLGLQITRDRAQHTITLTQSHMVQQVLQRFDFTYSSPQATPLSTRHSLSALPSDESVEPTYPELVALLVQYVGLGASAWILYVDNKAMLALCREHRREHKTKHIALRYFLARELQQRGQLRLAYVASEANTADIFTKAVPPGDHQRFCTMLGLVPTWPHLLNS
ncbi:unnamed protein product, partial [Closterium sp. NIES-54]